MIPYGFFMEVEGNTQIIHMKETGITQRTIGLMAVINPPEETGKSPLNQFCVCFSWVLGAHLFNSVPTPLPNPTAKDDLAAKNAISRITAFSMQERN